MSTNQNNKSNTWVTVPVATSNVFIPGPWFNYNPWGPASEKTEEDSGTKDDRDGKTCKKCGEFAPFAEANQEDKKTFICYSCRHGY